MMLCINSGSSSIKFSVYAEVAPFELVASGKVVNLYESPTFHGRNLLQDTDECIALAVAQAPIEGSLAYIHQWLHKHIVGEISEIGVVVHRIVHGGDRHQAVVITPPVMQELESIIPLAPLHLPSNIAAITRLQSLLPHATHVASFDTSFHAGQPLVAQQYALPTHFFSGGIKRYGFHGLSYQSVYEQLLRLDEGYRSKTIIVAHLGSGASLCGIKDGKSQYCTMGFSTLDGLTMGTRCGALDPGVILYLLNQGHSYKELENLLYHQSGLLGLSGCSADLGTLLALKTKSANTAIEHFIYSIVRELGALIATLGGVDALVFTAGIGENSPFVREQVCNRIAHLGFSLNRAKNSGATGSSLLSRASSQAAIWVINTDEENVMASMARAVLKNRPITNFTE